jgi:hypothetical protein
MAVRDHPSLEVVLGGVASQLVVLGEQDVGEANAQSEPDRAAEQPPLSRRLGPTIESGRSVHPSAKFSPADQRSIPGEINTVPWYHTIELPAPAP